MLSVGQVFKDVLEIEEVRRGGLGIVYIARIRSEAPVLGAERPGESGGPPRVATLARGNRVAIKAMSTDDFLSADVGAAFKNEALLWISLPPHPYVVSCISIDGYGLTPLIILEYVSEGNLRDRLGRGPLPLPEALRIGRQVCSGMHFLHQAAGVVHRDLKPENLLLDHHGDIKIADFGLASVQTYGLRILAGTSIDESPAGHAATRFIGGTLPYMSPEHFGDSEVTVRSDIYSFGVVLYEILTGRPPFRRDTYDAFRRAHADDRPPPLVKASEPAAFAKLIEKCLHKKPSRRFSDFQELDEALAGIARKRRIVQADPRRLTIAEAERAMSANDWTNRGYALGRLLRYEESLRCYQRAYDLDPRAAGANGNMAVALGRLGRTDQKLEYLSRELELHPEVPYSHYNLAAEYSRLGQWPAALEYLLSALDTDPSNIAFMRYLVMLYKGMDRPDDSRRTVREIVSRLSADPVIGLADGLIHEGIEFGSRGYIEESLIMLDQCVERFPDDAGGWYNRAVTLLASGQVDHARESVARALAVARPLPQADFLLGWMHLEEADPGAAAREWQDLLYASPDHQFSQMATLLLEMLQLFDLETVLAMAASTFNFPAGLYYM